jgi:glycosyltransferase involved in cell wall biosynthesis
MASGLRILIDARMLLGRFSGVARVVTRLVENLVSLPDIQVVVLCGDEPYVPWVGRHDIEMVVSDFSRRDRAPVRRSIWEATRLPKWIAESQADVFHAIWNTGIPFRCPVPTVLTVHDVIPWDEPCRGLSARLAQTGYRYSLRASVARARRVTAVSGFTAVEVARRVRIDPASVRVIYNGVDDPKPIAESGSTGERPYILYVGGHEPRKNLEAIFGALASYWSDYDPAIELHLTGSADQLGSVARSAYDKLESKDRVRFLGSPSDADLAREYCGARALLLLSRAEGFGLPILEAMSYGCPVIAAQGGCLSEIVGEAGILVDPHDENCIARCIHENISSPEKTEALANKGRRRAAGFSWRRAADSYLREYQFALTPSTVTPRWQSITGNRLACTS